MSINTRYCINSYTVYMTDSFTHSVPGIRDGNQMVVGGREVINTKI